MASFLSKIIVLNPVWYHFNERTHFNDYQIHFWDPNFQSRLVSTSMIPKIATLAYLYLTCLTIVQQTVGFCLNY